MIEPITVYQDSHLLVVNKPAGLVVHAARVHGARREEGTTLADQLLAKYPELASVGDDPETRPGIVHRLDKETSGRNDRGAGPENL